MFLLSRSFDFVELIPMVNRNSVDFVELLLRRFTLEKELISR